MTEPLRPASNSTYGRHNWIFVPSIAAQGAPTVAEITGASSLDFTNIAFAAWTKPDQTTNMVSAERRFGDTIVYQQVGTTQQTGGDMVYAFDPTSAALSTGRKGWEKFGAGVSGFLVDRAGIPKATTPIATHKVNVYPVSFGPSLPVEQGDGETGETAAKCSYAVTGPASLDVAIV